MGRGRPERAGILRISESSDFRDAQGGRVTGRPTVMIAFLRNHKEAIAAMDFFTVPTASLRLLYGFFVIAHGRRHVLHFNATFDPTAAWVIQQLREAFPFDTAPKYFIFDRGSIFSPAVMRFIKAMGTKPFRISFRSLWRNSHIERVVVSLRRELLDHVIVFNERHLKRLLYAYVDYYHPWRTHRSLDQDTPDGRRVRVAEPGQGVEFPIVQGLRHYYLPRAA